MNKKFQKTFRYSAKKILGWYKGKVVYHQKLFFQSGVAFFYSLHFRPRPAPSSGFLKKVAGQFQFHLNRMK